MKLILETQRLILRPFDLHDVQAAIAISTRPIVRHFMEDMIFDTPERAEGWIRMLHRICEPASPTVVLAIVPKGQDAPVGYIGLHPKEELDNEVEILYALMDEEQNRGYTTEAGRALLDWCFANTANKFITAIVKPDNIASNRVVQKLGFAANGEKTIPYNGKDTRFLYYRLYAPK